MQKEDNHNRQDYTPDAAERTGTELQSTEISTMRAKATKKSKFFNWLDILIIVVLVAAVLCIVFRFNPFTGKTAKENTQPITFTVYLQNVDSVFADSVKKGYAVYENDESGRYLGSVENVEITPASVFSVEHVDGDEGQASANLLNVKVTVKVDAARYSKKNGYSVNGVRLAVGAEKQFKFTSFVADGTIIGLSAESDS